ncbi:MAG: ATPase, T2SS/T4P/T4SS family [Proteobacteria bacterium]|nr:ATPase, T2SS/T4P/T4SS family [Pseudomonadota bacterium]
MIELYDLATFPASQCPDDAYLEKPVSITLLHRRQLNGLLLEFNGPRAHVIVELQSGRRVKVHFSDIRFIRFNGAIPKKATDLQVFAGHIEFKDGSDWPGEVIYYLNDVYGLHLLAREDGETHRIFFPADIIQDQQVSALFGQVLMDKINLSRQDLEAGLARQKELRRAGNKNVPKLGTILCEDGKVSEGEVQRALAESLGLEFLILTDQIPDHDALELIPEEMARDYGVVPISLKNNVLRVAMVDPKSTEALNTVSFVTGHLPEPVLTTQASIDWALGAFYRDISADIEEEQTEQPDEAEITKKMGNEAPIVRLVNNILSQAIRKGTSDIHIRPNEKNIELIFRIDGVMTLIKELKPSMLPALVSRIKIMGGMDISERRLPQDGQIRVVEEGAVIDMRVSVIPTVDGESVVIRLLNTKCGPLSIAQLGFAPDQEEAFLSNLNKAHGLILVTGPTGSGKSTTLYAALDVLKQKNLSIITIENPVEFHIPGVEQVQVNAPIGLTFARVLRNILRHDPEVIMLGEIRDQETAKISIESAMTGHLVLSTLHTNSALGAISRLLDMDIENYILAPTLLCVVAQRLLRKNCEHCVAQEEVDPGMLKHMGLDPGEVFYRGTGCDKCEGLGLKGRVGVYEVLNASARFREGVSNSIGEAALYEIARQDGMSSLMENALALAREKKIDIAQVFGIATDL